MAEITDQGLYSALLGDADPARIALETADGRIWSYAEVAEAAGRYAGALTKLGAQAGERVLCQVEKSPGAIFAYLGCLRIGAVFVPLNTAYTAHEVRHFVEDAEPVVLICGPSRRSEFEADYRDRLQVTTLDADGQGTLNEAAAGSNPAAVVGRQGSDIAAILYTSGTTGRPKGAMLTNRNLASNAEVLRQSWQITASDVLLHTLPVFHAHGLFVALNTALFANARTRLFPKFDAAQAIENLDGSTIMMGVPTYYTRMLAQPELTLDACRTMRLFISGSAPLSDTTFQNWEQRTGHRILERYGLTETLMNTSNPYDGPRKPGTVGRSLPGVDLRIVHPDTGAKLPDGETGMVQVRGPNVFAGYWRMPDKTTSDFTGDFFVTGDLGRIDEDGYLEIVGRDKDLIISGGLNVYPKEVEMRVNQLENIMESAVVGLPHPEFGEAVTAFVVLAKNTALDEADARRRLEGSLAKFKLPKRLVVVEGLPRNAMGKVQKAGLRADYAALYAAPVPIGLEG